MDRAARALARGDALAALALVGRPSYDSDARALLLRGIAYAQMGDVELAKDALERARDADPDALTAARVDAALAEIAASGGEPREASRAALAAARALEALGDVRNAAMQRLVAARAEVLLGRLGEARRNVGEALARDLPADVRAVARLTEAEIAVRELAATRAAKALADAKHALASAPHALLARALAAQESELRVRVARLFERGETRAADLFAIEEASRGDRFLVDACRRIVVAGHARVPLATRPVLFALLASLARAWPSAIRRDVLIAEAFGARKPNASHRARLRVEVGRLRKVLAGIAEPVATAEGYALESPRPVAILLPPTDDADARIALLLADGATWTAQSIADHAGVSKRTALRALAALVESGRAVRVGSARDSRYAGAGGRIASRMLLLGLVPTR
ncbi:MAG TPA: HTH domain-containing protein [Labilithrix sp.]